MRLVVVFFVGVFASTASAQDLGDARLSLDLGLLQYSSEHLAVPMGADVETTRTHFSLLSAGVGLTVAATLSDRLSLGGRVLLDRDATTVDDLETVRVQWQVGPELEVRFGSGGMVRPFGLVGLFFAGTKTTVGDMDPARLRAFGFHIGGGAHIFLHDHVSLDPQLDFAYQTGLGDAEHTRWTFSILVGLTAWLGSSAEVELTRAPVLPTGVAVEPAAEPQLLFAREGERKTAVRLVVETNDSRLEFTYGGPGATHSASVEVSARHGGRARRCGRFNIRNGTDQASGPFDGRTATVPMNDLLRASQGQFVTARFCDRFWRPNAMEQQAFRRFGEEAWAIRRAADAAVAAPAEAAPVGAEAAPMGTEAEEPSQDQPAPVPAEDHVGE